MSKRCVQFVSLVHIKTTTKNIGVLAITVVSITFNFELLNKYIIAIIQSYCLKVR